MDMLRKALAVVSLPFFVAAAPAFAHGEAAHGKRAAGEVPKEQMAWGIAGERREVSRTVEIRMDDAMRFKPDRLKVRVGETVRFVLHNDGKLMHELVLGTKAVLDEHAAAMRKFPNMEHDEPYIAHVAPGKRGEIVWKFNRPGAFDFACLIPGHYESGMVGRIDVQPKRGSR